MAFSHLLVPAQFPSLGLTFLVLTSWGASLDTEILGENKGVSRLRKSIPNVSGSAPSSSSASSGTLLKTGPAEMILAHLGDQGQCVALVLSNQRMPVGGLLQHLLAPMAPPSGC